MTSNLDHEYAPIGGSADFCKLTAELAFGSDAPAISANALATIQTISGTGALRIGGAFLHHFWAGNKEIYVPTPTWGNHTPLFNFSGLKVNKYKYYHPETCGLDFQGTLSDISVSNQDKCIRNIRTNDYILFRLNRIFPKSR